MDEEDRIPQQLLPQPYRWEQRSLPSAATAATAYSVAAAAVMPNSEEGDNYGDIPSVGQEDEEEVAIDKKYPKRFGTKAQRMAGKRKVAEKRFLAKYEELKAFKEEHGHLNVPTTANRKLSSWLSHQRDQYQLYAELNDKENPPTFVRRQEILQDSSQFFDAERVHLLEQLGFDFRRRTDTKWLESYEKLCAYKEKHGHVCVSKRRNKKTDDNNNSNNNSASADRSTDDHDDDGDDQLQSWLSTQRRLLLEYRGLQRQMPKSKMKLEKLVAEDSLIPTKAERIAKLDELGMIWSLNDYEWTEKLKLLQRYKKEHGSCDVPNRFQMDSVSLGKWCAKQRDDYRKIGTKAGKRPALTSDRLFALLEIGFRFKPLQPNNKRNTSTQAVESLLSDQHLIGGDAVSDVDVYGPKGGEGSSSSSQQQPQQPQQQKAPPCQFYSEAAAITKSPPPELRGWEGEAARREVAAALRPGAAKRQYQAEAATTANNKKADDKEGRNKKSRAAKKKRKT